MPPKYKVCYICGREYGSTSLDIHQKQCIIKREKEQALLPPHMRTALNPPSPGTTMTNDQAFDNWKQSLAACNMCGRTFLPDRLLVHQRSCKGDNKRSSSSSSSSLPPPQDYNDYGAEKSSPTMSRQSTATAGTTRVRPPSGSFGKTNPVGSGFGSGGSSGGMSGFGNAGSSGGMSGFGSGGSSGGMSGFGNAGSGGMSGFGNTGRGGSSGGMSGFGSGGGGGGMSGFGNTSSAGGMSGFGNGGGGRGSGGFDNGFGYDPPTSQMSKTTISGNSTNSINSANSTIGGNSRNSTKSSSTVGTRPPSTGSTKSAPPKASAPAPRAAAPAGRGVPFAVNQGNLVPCRTCGRTFNEDRIEKHENICQDVTNQTRKTFDSSKARVKGTEMESVKVKPSRKPAAKSGGKWRQQHAEFMNAVKQARMITKIQQEGGDLSLLPPPPPSLNPDYIQCPHCNRRFNETAAERHIPKCKTTVNKPKPPPTSIPPRQVPPKSSASRSPAQPKAAASNQYGASSSSYGQTTSSGYGASSSGYGASNSGYGASSSSGYGASSSGYSNYPVSTSTAKRQPTSSTSSASRTTSTTTRTSATPARTASATTQRAGPASASARGPAPVAKKSGNFCGHCGNKYESERMRFCGECGQAR